MDAAGHGSYWGSSLYYEMAKEKDRQVAGILNALAKTKTSSGNVDCQLCPSCFIMLAGELESLTYKRTGLLDRPGKAWSQHGGNTRVIAHEVTC